MHIMWCVAASLLLQLSSVSGSITIPKIIALPEEHTTSSSICEVRIFSMENVTMLKHEDVFVIPLNKTFNKDAYQIDGSKLQVCVSESDLNCSKSVYDRAEYEVLANDTVQIYEHIVKLGQYFITNYNLLVCDEDYDYSNMNLDELENPSHKAQTIIGKIGASISTVTLTAHLVAFCITPEMRNMPGYNMASLSLSFLLAYTFLLIGQIPQVLGTFCVISAVVKQNFLLSAFSWMNVMAFDLWQTLRRATQQLVLNSGRMKMKFALYSAYAWGLPLIFSIAAVAADNSDSVPKEFRSGFGNYDHCWPSNPIASTVFFIGPAFVLLIVNAVFFILSAYIVASNTMKATGESRCSAKVNFVLYLKMALIMGVTWVLGVVAIFTPGKVLWFIFDILNSFQGVFLFLMFTCSSKAFRQLKNRIRKKMSTATIEKNTSSSDTKSDHANGIPMQEKY